MLTARTSLALVAALAACSDVRDEDPFVGGTSGGVEDPGSTGGSTTTGDPGQTSAPAETSAAPSDSSGDDTSQGVVPEDDTKFDVAGIDDVDASGGCGGSGGGLEFSYIWIANSNQSTVSKIDTQTMVEVGRYVTRPDGMGNPSRTSVSLNGDVAVANRSGGITMIHARTDDCPDPANTSTGPDDVLPWQDGCIGWHTPMSYQSQRPVAWTKGTFNPATCTWEDARVWTSGASTTNPVAIEVLLLDGETGVVLETVPIPEVPAGEYGFGLYGAAVDGDGNFWGSQLNMGYLVRVDIDDMTHESWPMPTIGYGMTVDHEGRPWICNEQVARFDPLAEMWTIGAATPGPGGAGCMEDGNGTMWVAGYSLVAIDVETMQEIASYAMPVIDGNPDTGYGRGVSIDFDGYVWSPSHWSNAAYRLDPETGQFDSVQGLDFPYTYSDMTGFALANAGTPAG